MMEQQSLVQDGDNKSGRTIIIAMDGSDHSNHAFYWFMNNLYRDTDFLILAFCAEYGSHLSNTAALGSPEAIRLMLDKHEGSVKKVLVDINEHASKYQPNYRVERLSDPPGASIIRAARDQNADMIICGSRGHGSLRRTILGSVSDYLVSHSDIPVTVCKQ